MFQGDSEKPNRHEQKNSSHEKEIIRKDTALEEVNLVNIWVTVEDRSEGTDMENSLLI